MSVADLFVIIGVGWRLNNAKKKQPNLPANPLLPEDMKTEDEILAQMRASQAASRTSPLSFLVPPPPPPPVEVDFPKTTLDMESLQKLISNEEPKADGDGEKVEKAAKSDQNAEATKAAAKAEPKPAKEAAKADNKQAKPKEAAGKIKKKAKEEKKEESAEIKPKEEGDKRESRSAEPSPSPKNKKEDKSNKKELEKEKKEWIKEGFTIVKGAEKTKDSKKKADEVKAAEEAERKKKEEEKAAAEEKKRQLEIIKKQQEMQSLEKPQRQAESVMKKAPWSAQSQALQATNRDGLTLAEIQRLEREKKLEQMKEQQQMMQLIAQQQAVALAREQEMQAGLGWAKKKLSPASASQTLAEIQAEARKQAAAAAAASAVMAAREEVQVTPPPPVINVPWGNVQNGGVTAGFWDTPAPEPVKPTPKPVEPKPAPVEPKPKKKVTVIKPPKKESTPSVEFENWCNDMLVSLKDSNIDIPTFVAFLRDIESPYEVKDYVKCYLGDGREANDFARQFLEKRSRLLRVGMATPSDDLCSPAAAVNPRTNSGSDYTEVKNKGKKTKKNKMVKLDVRILGFSVTASEDRINVGDIDTV